MKVEKKHADKLPAGLMKSATCLLREMPFGVPFRSSQNPSALFIRVKPVNYLLNSTLLVDVINRGKVVVCNLEKGTIFVTDGYKRAVLAYSWAVDAGDVVDVAETQEMF